MVNLLMKSAISGGLTVLVDSADELAVLQALCLECVKLAEFSYRVHHYDQPNGELTSMIFKSKNLISEMYWKGFASAWKSKTQR